MKENNELLKMEACHHIFVSDKNSEITLPYSGGVIPPINYCIKCGVYGPSLAANFATDDSRIKKVDDIYHETYLNGYFTGIKVNDCKKSHDVFHRLKDYLPERSEHELIKYLECYHALNEMIPINVFRDIEDAFPGISTEDCIIYLKEHIKDVNIMPYVLTKKI